MILWVFVIKEIDLIDDVAFFNVALGDDDLKFIMDNGIMAAGAVDYVGKLSTTWAQIREQ